MRLSPSVRGMIAGSRRAATASRPFRSAVRQQQRSIATESRTNAQAQAGFWTTTRVGLLTATAGSLAYLVGINDSSLHFKSQDGKKSKKPVYAKKKDLETVRSNSSTIGLKHKELRF